MATTAPTIPEAWRTRVYVGSLITEAAVVLAAGMLLVLGIVDTVTSLALVGAVTAPLAILNSGLATGYRPTRPDAT